VGGALRLPWIVRPVLEMDLLVEKFDVLLGYPAVDVEVLTMIVVGEFVGVVVGKDLVPVDREELVAVLSPPGSGCSPAAAAGPLFAVKKLFNSMRPL